MADSILPVESTCDVNFDKKEFAIVGDALFASTIEETPPWLQQAITDQVTAANLSTLMSLTNYNTALVNALNSINIAKNTYEQYTNKIITDNAAFVDSITTLNSTISANDASIRELLLTYATTTEVNASIATAISTSLSGGDIKAAINSVQNASSTQWASTTQRLNTLESTFFDNATQQSANALATQALETYTGYGIIDGSTPQLLANTNFYTNLNAYLNGSGWTTGGTSTLVDEIKASANNVTSSFAYNSTININGAYYKTGFGINSSAHSSGAGTEINPFSSEFWIQADSLKIKDSQGKDHIAWNATTDTLDFTGTINASRINTGYFNAGVFNVNSLNVESSVAGNYGPFSFTKELNWSGSTSEFYLGYDSIVSPSYSSGYHGKRLRAFNSPIIVQMTLFGDFNVINATLQVSYDGVNFTDIANFSGNLNYRSGITVSKTITLASSGWDVAYLRWHFNGSGVVQYFSSLLQYNAGML